MNKLITIVMPIYNGASTLEKVFNSLENQYNKKMIKQVICINDNSSDKSQQKLEIYKKSSSFNVIIIRNNVSRGLSNGYNKGILASKSKYVLLMHQDILLGNKNSFQKILYPFLKNKNTVISYPILLHPRKIWDTYNIWQKSLFDRFMGKKIPMLTGKFDLIDKDVFLKKIGLFDADTYRTAGEDSDIKKKIILHKELLVMENSGLEVVHLHNCEESFSYLDLIKKESQLAEAQGVLLRIYGTKGGTIKDFLMIYFRPFLIFSLFVPYFNIISVGVIYIYAYMYTRNVFKASNILFFDKIKIYILNIFLLFLSTYWTIRGFIVAKQHI